MPRLQTVKPRQASCAGPLPAILPACRSQAEHPAHLTPLVPMMQSHPGTQAWGVGGDASDVSEPGAVMGLLKCTRGGRREGPTGTAARKGLDLILLAVRVQEATLSQDMQGSREAGDQQSRGGRLHSPPIPPQRPGQTQPCSWPLEVSLVGSVPDF